MKLRSVIALGILLETCQAGEWPAVRDTTFTAQRLGLAGNLPTRLAQNLAVSPWTGDLPTGSLRVSDGCIEFPIQAAKGSLNHRRHYAQITVTPDRGRSLEEVRLAWRLRSAPPGLGSRGTTLVDVWAFPGTNEHAAVAFGSVIAPSSGFAFLNWMPGLNSEPGQPYTLRFYAWATGIPEQSSLLILNDVNLSGKTVACPTSAAVGFSPVAVLMGDFAGFIRSTLDALHDRSSLQSLAGLANQMLALHQATQASLWAAVIIAVSALLGFLLTAWMLLRTQARFAPRNSQQKAIIADRGMCPNPVTPDAIGERAAALDVAHQAATRHFRALERLEKRIRGLEQGPASHIRPTEADRANTKPASRADQKSLTTGKTVHLEDPHVEACSINMELQFEVLIGQGQAHFSLNQHEQAQQCFAEAARLRPNNTDALVRNGLALERLQKHETAIACFERAISLDPSLSTAWLHLGRICNRLERHRDATACYERAIRPEPSGVGAPLR